VSQVPDQPQQFLWDDLARYKAEGRFLDGYPDDYRTFWAPRDQLHGLLRDLIASAQHSVVVNMFGFTDETLMSLLRRKLESPSVYVQISLDRTQAKGKTEADLLKEYLNDAEGNSVAIGTSEKLAISHLKVVIVDGVYSVTGSTNWSLSGEEKQDNQLTLSRNAVVAAETRAVLDRNHDFMLKQMAKRRTSTMASSAGVSGGPTSG
jgi:phosphatidylserine/phosphatidylglycerophosphate/cardiolipin synthase-like enzyme